jgi:hypothetical protein
MVVALQVLPNRGGIEYLLIAFQLAKIDLFDVPGGVDQCRLQSALTLDLLNGFGVL